MRGWPFCRCLDLPALDCQSQVFQEIDTSGDGILQLDEFVAGIEKVPLRRPRSLATHLANRAQFASQLPGLDKLIVDGECLSSKPQPPSFLDVPFRRVNRSRELQAPEACGHFKDLGCDARRHSKLSGVSAGHTTSKKRRRQH